MPHIVILSIILLANVLCGTLDSKCNTISIAYIHLVLFGFYYRNHLIGYRFYKFSFLNVLAKHASHQLNLILFIISKAAHACNIYHGKLPISLISTYA